MSAKANKTEGKSQKWMLDSKINRRSDKNNERSETDAKSMRWTLSSGMEAQVKKLDAAI